MTRRAGRAGAGLLGVLLLATGCGQDAAPPTTLPPVTPSTTPSATPSATGSTPSAGSGSPTPTPGELDEATQAEAEAFVAEFWGVVNAGLETGSAVGIDAYYEPSCAECQSIADDVAALQREGQRAVGATLRVVETSFDTSNGPVALVESVVQAQPGQLVNSDGSLVREVTGGPPSDYVFNIVHLPNGDWTIQHLLALGPRAE
jgi:hypothetical protein